MILISRASQSSAMPLSRRAMAAAIVAATVLGVTGGCGIPGIGGSSGGGSAVSASAVSFHFQRFTGDDMMDQALTITNTSGKPVVPTLRFTALDNAGQPIAGVTVTTAYGSDRGQLVVGTKSGIDILAFHGANAYQAVDVQVDVTSLTTAERLPVIRDLTTAFQDASGKTVDRFGDFDKMLLTNPNDIDATVRIVYIVWDQPADQYIAQQAVSVTPIGGLIVIPRHGMKAVQVDGAAAAAIARYGDGTNAISVKVFPSQ